MATTNKPTTAVKAPIASTRRSEKSSEVIDLRLIGSRPAKSSHGSLSLLQAMVGLTLAIEGIERKPYEHQPFQARSRVPCRHNPPSRAAKSS